MNWKVIKTEKEYKKAMDRLEEIFDAEKGSPEGDELEQLALLIHSYEEAKYPIFRQQ